MAKKKPGKERGLKLARSPAIEVDGEAEKVLQFLLEGLNEYQIDERLRGYLDGNQKRSVMAALQKRLERMGSESEPDVIRGWCYEAHRLIYRKALESEDYATALKAVKEIERLAST